MIPIQNHCNDFSVPHVRPQMTPCSLKSQHATSLCISVSQGLYPSSTILSWIFSQRNRWYPWHLKESSVPDTTLLYHSWSMLQPKHLQMQPAQKAHLNWYQLHQITDIRTSYNISWWNPRTALYTIRHTDINFHTDAYLMLLSPLKQGHFWPCTRAKYWAVCYFYESDGGFGGESKHVDVWWQGCEEQVHFCMKAGLVIVRD